ncbi:MAG: phytanoyl-CoA dioxygenase family protein [Phycisphaeraceae bacterium]
MQLDHEQKETYREQGYLVMPGLFPEQTVREMTEHYMRRREEGGKPGDMGGRSDDPNDPLNRYPRMINMHKWDERTGQWAQNTALLSVVQQLLDDRPRLHQTMLYFKPPGARGQGLHQDEQYITIEPLLGAWLALDVTDAANGQMVVVPGSHALGLLPIEAADPSTSFTHGQTRMPAGAEEVGIDMQPGDVLLFDGKIIHGSHSNTTDNRFRRSFICHFIGEHARQFTPAKGQHMSHLNK